MESGTNTGKFQDYIFVFYAAELRRYGDKFCFVVLVD